MAGPTLNRTPESLAKEAEEAYKLRRSLVHAERDRRIASGIMFNAGDGSGEVLFQTGSDSRENIQGAASLATAALLGGALPGDLMWHGGTDPFMFLSADNTPIPMDAPTALTFGQTAARWKSLHIFASQALKSIDPLPANFDDDSYWPTWSDL